MQYRNTGETKPGQTQAGSGTTPTLLAGGKLVAITDNDDPMNVLAFKRAINPREAPPTPLKNPPITIFPSG